MSNKRVFKQLIKGIEWEFHSLSNASYVRRHGNDSGAITYTNDHDVFFNSSHFSPGIVRHEVFHTYIASSGTNSASLTSDQMEELCAEIYQSHGPEMDLLVDKILEFFLR